MKINYKHHLNCCRVINFNTNETIVEKSVNIYQDHKNEYFVSSFHS